MKREQSFYLRLTLAVTTCPSFSIFSIVAVGKNGKMTRNDLTRYLCYNNEIINLLQSAAVYQYRLYEMERGRG